MPNSRQRKFTVHDVNAGNRTSTSAGADRSVNITEDLASSAVLAVTKTSATTDKDVTASSSNIDLFSYMQTPDDVLESKMTYSGVKQIKHLNRERRERARQHRIKVRSPRRRMPHEMVRVEVVTTSTGCDAIKWAQETEVFNMTNITSVAATVDDRASERSLDDMCRICHGGESLSMELGPLISACNCRGTVRSKRGRMPHEMVRVEVVTTSTGCDAIKWAQETEVFNMTNITSLAATVDDRASERSLDDMCRICHGGESLSLELGPLISACNCRGTVGRVHVRCLERWLTESGKNRCELCGARYATRRVHRYGVPKAVLMWVLSRNAKQLMVDSLGIMLMSPLAVLAAWLSGRTLAGLMMQEGHVTPWPLASTFVLACMTLVCYYCWIVSAATRHALGWWIWYRSQYEVRLLLQDTEES